jgi:hypothetical protein
VTITEDVTQSFNSKSAGTTLFLGTSGTRVAGKTLAVGLTFDNLSATTPTISINKPAGETNDWVIAYHNSPQSAGAGGVRGAIAVIQTTVDWSATNVTVTFSGSITAKGAVIKVFSGATATERAAASGTTSSGAKSSSASGQVGDLVLILGSTEQDNGNPAVWSSSDETIQSQVSSGTSGGSAVTNATATFAYAVLGTAGARTFTLATVTDGGAVVWVLQPASSGVQHTVDQTDNLGMTDQPVQVMDMFRADVEDLNLTDSAVIAQGHVRNQADNLGLTDSATVLVQKIFTVNQTDNLGLTGTQVIAQTHNLNQSDSLGLTDSATVTLGGGLNQSVTDDLGLTDSVNVQLQSTATIGTPTVLTTAETTTDNTVFNTASVTLQTGRLYVIHISSGGTGEQPTISGDHGTWNHIATQSVPNGTVGHSAFWIAGNGATDNITITFTTTRTNIMWKVIEVTGTHLTTPIPAGQIETLAGTALSLTTTLNNAPAATSIAMSFIIYNAANTQTITLPGGYSAIGVQTDMTSPASLSLEAYDPVVADATADWTTSSLSGKSIISFEIAVGVAAGTSYSVDQVDPLGLTDSVTIAVGNSISTSDSLGLTDSFVAAKIINVNISDSLGIFDGNVITDTGADFVDTLGLTDSASVVLQHARNQIDSLGLTDSVTFVFQQNLVKENVVELTDVATVVMGLAKSISDALGLTDTATAVVSGSTSFTDSEGLTDIAVVAQSHVRNQSDNLGLTDSVTVVVGNAISQSDTEGLTDSFTAAQAHVRNQADNLGLTDSASVVVSGTGSISDNLGLTDSVTIAFNDVHPVSDNLGLTDTVTVALSYGRSQSDNLGLTDSVSISVGNSQTFLDTESMTDSVSVVLNSVVSRSDSIGLTDLAVIAEAHARNQLDLLGITDTFTVTLGRVAAPGDTLGLTDIAVVRLNSSIFQSDTLTMTDIFQVTTSGVASAFVGWGIPI